jgi:hypothetical protein
MRSMVHSGCIYGPYLYIHGSRQRQDMSQLIAVSWRSDGVRLQNRVCWHQSFLGLRSKATYPGCLFPNGIRAMERFRLRDSVRKIDESGTIGFTIS